MLSVFLEYTIIVVFRDTISSSHFLFTNMDDFSHLPLGERLVHSVWKVRLQAYDELGAQFAQKNAPQHVFANADLIKTTLADSNVVAQEAAVACFLAFLTHEAAPAAVSRLRSSGVVTTLSEKGLSSSRAGTKAKTQECLLTMVELAPKSSDVNDIVEDVLLFTSAKLPKLVAGSIAAVTAVVDAFGCAVVLPQPIVPCIPKLFAHADRNVRAEATKLCVVLYQWLGDAVSTMVFADLKPVQQRDLGKAFESVERTSTAKRLTRSQQEKQSVSEPVTVPDNQVEEDVPMDDAFDAFDVIPPVDVLAKFPSDFYTQIQSSQWKERKETLDEVHSVLEKTARLQPADDYTDFVRALARCLKDANIIVVQLAANCVEYLAKGLREGFLRYRPMVMDLLVERTKEKKASVSEALNSALDAIFQYSTLGDVLGACVAGMNSKVPPVKIASADYLCRCLALTKEAVTEPEVSEIMAVGAKLLADSLEPVRQSATKMVGTLMKLVGERPLKNYLEKVDDNRRAKVMKIYENAEVSYVASSARPAKAVSSALTAQTAQTRTSKTTRPKDGTEPVRKLALPGGRQTIPSKRGATSPAKREDKPGRGLAARSLPEPTLSSIPSLESQNQIDAKDRAELEQLRREREQWIQERVLLIHSQERTGLEKDQLAQQLELAGQQLQAATRDAENALLLLKQKDAQILRLNSDLDTAKLKIRDLDQTVEMMRLQQTATQLHFSPVSPYPVSSRLTSGELSSRVHRLSIDGQIDPVPTVHRSPQKVVDSTNTQRDVDFSTNDDSWSHAAEITSQLKARIEKMKATRRGIS